MAGKAGNLNVTWIHGSPNCATTVDPPIQVHRFDDDTFILRQSKCSEPGTPANPGSSFEAPFMYLLVGSARALLLDSGASQSPVLFPIANTVGNLLSEHAAALGKPPVPQLIAHSHSHGDHIAGDIQFHGKTNTTIVPPGLPNVKAFFSFPHWPDGAATIELGNRTLDVIPIPGHESSHLAVYDRTTQLLLTGDTLYPGLLVVEDWLDYARSIARLKSFADLHPISFILGAHVEMKNQPKQWFGLGTLFQPNEHVLQLDKSHLVELHNALTTLGIHGRTERHADFIIYPADQPLPPNP